MNALFIARPCTVVRGRHALNRSGWSARRSENLGKQAGVVQAQASDSAVTKGNTSSKLTKEQMFEKAEWFIEHSGFYGHFTEESKDFLDKDFVFRGPVIGPLSKQGYIESLSMFNIPEAFPDISANPWGFSIDPTDPMRVWFMVRETGTMTRPWKPLGEDGPTLEATNKAIMVGPSTYSMIFTPEGRIKYLSIGYIADRIASDAPGGSTGVAVVALARAANAPDISWLFEGGPLPTGVRETSFAVLKATGMDDVGPPAWEELPEWFKALPNSKLKYGEGM